jgi:hypothetical protein
VLLELYIELREKDHKWTPERGRYITFAAKLAQRHLIGLRDKARTVQSPRNSSSRMAEYRQEIEDGTITEDRYRTYEDIKRSSSPYTSIGTHGSRGEPDWPEWIPGEEDDSVAEREHDRLSGDAITWGIMCLTPFEARVLGMSGGLWGQPRLALPEIAGRTGRSRDAVKKAKDRAEAKIKHRLLAMGHPAVASDN